MPELSRAGWVQFDPQETRCKPSVKGPMSTKCIRFMCDIKVDSKVRDYSTDAGCTALCEGFKRIESARWQ